MRDFSASPYNKNTVLDILFQAETLQHQRIYYMLVAETIFFLAAGSAITHHFIVVILSLAGLAIAVIFTLINVKHYYRVVWLIDRMREEGGLYDDYVRFKGFNAERMDPISKLIASSIISHGDKGPVWFMKTGFLLTWGLLIVVVATWLVFIAYGFLGLLAPWLLSRCH